VEDLEVVVLFLIVHKVGDERCWVGLVVSWMVGVYV
jgi:hypothetical protein